MAETNPFREALKITPEGEANPFRAAMADMAQQAPAASPVGTATGIVRSATQGVTFGFGDEMEAGLKAMIDRQPGEDFAEAYWRHRDTIRSQMQDFSGDNPGTAMASEALGAMAVPGMATAKAAGSFIGRGATTMRQTGRAALVGAGEGAVYGAGTAQETSDIPAGMAGGAALGGAAGGGVNLAASGVRGFRDLLRGATSPETGADMRVAQAISRDELDPATVARELHEARTMGKPAIVADMGGRNVRGELELVTNQPGAGQNRAEQLLSTRNKDQLNRLSRDLVGTTGGNRGNVVDVIEETMATRAHAATPLYRDAMEFQAELSPEIVNAYRKAVGTPLGKQALTKAKRILNVENFDDAPLMMRIDAFKKGLDDVIESAKRSGDKNIARKGLEMLKTQNKDGLIDLVDAANPKYAQARDVWSDGASYLDAIDEGRKIMSNKVTAAELEHQWRGLSNAGREAYKIGAVDAIITKMRQQSAQEPNLLKLLRSPEIKDKLTVMMSPNDARRFNKLLDIEEKMFATSSTARGNSRTSGREAAREEQEKQTRLVAALGMVAELATSPLRSTFGRAIPYLTNATRQTVLSRQSAAIADRLLSQSPQTLQPATTIGAAARPRPSRRATAAAIPAAIAPAIQDSPQ